MTRWVGRAGRARRPELLPFSPSISAYAYALNVAKLSGDSNHSHSIVAGGFPEMS